MKLKIINILIHGVVFSMLSFSVAAEPVITEDDLFAEIDTVSGVIHMRQT